MIARAAAAVLVTLALGGGIAAADTFRVPALTGHVVDTSGKLSGNERAELERELDGSAIAVFVPGSLAGSSIDDVAYETFNAWQLGDKGADNGVLLVVAPVERRIRIETGKGVGGALTDLEANDIIRLDMQPLIARGELAGAISLAAAKIRQELAKDAPPVQPVTAPPSPATPLWPYAIVGVLILGTLAAAVKFPRVRRVLWPVLRVLFWVLEVLASMSGKGGGKRGRTRFKGGGGRSGGGGSSDSF